MEVTGDLLVDANNNWEPAVVALAGSTDNLPDEFQQELTKMRNSLNAITLRNFIFEETDHPTKPNIIDRGSNDFSQFKEIQPLEGVDTPKRRSLSSKHRQDARRSMSNQISPDDVIKALSASQEIATDVNSENLPKAHFDGQVKVKFLLEPSRESDEVAQINEIGLPWEKKKEFRAVTTPFFQPSKKSTCADNQAEDFRPIKSTRSTEDVQLEVLKPIPIFASKSFQDLQDKQFEDTELYVSRSIDDLLLDDIDGMKKHQQSKKSKLLKHRSTSNNSLNRSSWSHEEGSIYENFHYEPVHNDEEDAQLRKKPFPLPRASSQDNLVRNSITKRLTYVLDHKLDEFVLDKEEIVKTEGNFDEMFEDVLLRNEITADSDSVLFNSLLSVESIDALDQLDTFGCQAFSFDAEGNSKSALFPAGWPFTCSSTGGASQDLRHN